MTALIKEQHGSEDLLMRQHEIRMFHLETLHENVHEHFKPLTFTILPILLALLLFPSSLALLAAERYFSSLWLRASIVLLGLSGA